jgi:predicted AlkP superfamily pyrophosphatase or phosphodiesterase
MNRTNKQIMRPIFVLLQFVFLALLASPVLGDEDQPVRRALIIGIDGVRRDALEQAKTPHLDRLRRAGAFSANTAIVAPRPTKSDTVSGPGWSSILTGVWSDKHGVVDNKFAGSRYDEYPHFFARVKAHDRKAHTVSLVSWKPIKEKIVAAADVSEFLDLDGDSEALRDERMAKRAADVLTKTDPTAMFAYLHQVDAAGHRHGFHPSVDQYVEAIENADACVGGMLDALAKRPLAKQEEWLVVVCTDHGGRGTGHGKGHEYPEVNQVFLILHGPTVEPGETDKPTSHADVVPTVLAHLRVPIDPDWKLDGQPRAIEKTATR